jgi:hypothetical protein
MQGPSTPIEDDEASIPTEYMRNGLNQNRTFTVRRKAAKHTFPWDPEDINLAVPPHHDEDIQDTKRPRLVKPFPTSTDEATTNDESHDTAVAITRNTAAVNHADSDPVTDMQSNARATGVPRRWTRQEAAKLTSAVTNNSKKEHGKEYRTDCDTLVVLNPDQTLHSSVDLVPGRRGIKWTPDEDIKLKHALRMHDGKNWNAIAALVPGRTKKQCTNRWRKLFAFRSGEWTPDEDIKLKHAVQMHDGKNWDVIAALVPGRANSQCRHRWFSALDPRVVRTTAYR